MADENGVLLIAPLLYKPGRLLVARITRELLDRMWTSCDQMSDYADDDDEEYDGLDPVNLVFKLRVGLLDGRNLPSLVGASAAGVIEKNRLGTVEFSEEQRALIPGGIDCPDGRVIVYPRQKLRLGVLQRDARLNMTRVYDMDTLDDCWLSPLEVSEDALTLCDLPLGTEPEFVVELPDFNEM